MKKNVASQFIGAQMVSASDGSAFTGSVTVYVTGDAGTQAVGSVGSGACTHEGNGYHTYAPAQAETNYDLIAFTFIGSGAIPATIQVSTAFPQTGDSFARIGAPAGASISADIAALLAQLIVIDDFIDTEVAAIKAKTDNLPSDPADASDIAASFSTVNSTLATIAAYIDTEVAAIKAKTDNLPATPAATGDAMTLTSGERNSVADALLDRSAGIETGYTPRQALRLVLSALAGKLSGAAGLTISIRDIGDTKNRIVATVDASGNRTALTLDAT